LLADSQIEPSVFDLPGGRVPFRCHRELWVKVAESTTDPTFGLDVVGECIDAGSMGLLGLLAESCETLGDVFATVSASNSLANEASLMRTWSDGDKAYVLDAHTRDGSPYPPAMAEAVIAFYHRVIERTCPGQNWLLEVWFVHAAPPDVSRYRQVFGVAPQFSRPSNTLVLPRSALDLPLVTARTVLNRHLSQVAQDTLEQLSADADITDRVRAEIRLAGHALPTADELASTLGMSKRTLQRRVSESGGKLNILLDEERRARAYRLVHNTDHPMAEIAWRLGFAEVRSFRRAFKRWFGQPPSQARASSVDGQAH
jgi:AraC-like DNA-binding protein